jgi:hypothetical protein
LGEITGAPVRHQYLEIQTTNHRPSSHTLPRLLQNWRDRPGAIDQSNPARLLMSVMSTETCRKVVVACAEAGFIDRTRTPYGTMLVQSKGTLEDIFGLILRELRSRIQHET